MMKLKKFESVILALFILSTVAASLISYGIFLLLSESLEAPSVIAGLVAGLIWLFLLVILGIRHTKAALRPTNSMYAALEHLSAGPSDRAPPDPEAHGISKPLVEQVIKDIYELSSGQHEAQTKLTSAKEFTEAVINIQNNALLVLDRNAQIAFANQQAMALMPDSVETPVGLTMDQAYDLEFSSGAAFSDWLPQAQANKIQDHYVWERVRVARTDESVRYFDMIADYSKNESHGAEVVIVLVDKTASYHGDDQQMGFVSLAVHELRSPISLLRGYIEVFEDELVEALDDDQKLFMQKMSVSAAQLSTFVNNILNVARIESDQLKVHMHEDTIYDALNASREDFMLRAEVRNRKLKYELADAIPPVGLDRVAIYEVLSNLVDNAIKYSRDGEEIIVSATTSETGGITVAVQDFGVGVPESSMNNLFEQFYRSHHSRDKVSGTGLGLFLSKRLIEAHGGTIWVKSKENEGSTFGFDLPTYESMKNDERYEQSEENDRVVRSAHGWIKNHGKVRK